ncbi:MAG: 3'-5' exonuclease [Chloroflexi bacterium]|nr:3'-5' exonuclease [Chloroflexota bacterium]
MTTITAKIVSLQAGLTKNSQSPMWRCTTDTGERVNVFKHSDPDKNSFGLFEAAGYGTALLSMVNGQVMTWKNTPIEVTMTKDGQWWQVIAVSPRPDDCQPDPVEAPDRELYRAKAVKWASACFGDTRFIILDTETTGLNDDDEIVSIAVIDWVGETLIDTLIRPTDCDKLLRINPKKGVSASEINGITPEMLTSAPTFPEVYQLLSNVMDGAIWAGFNIQFDATLLERDCIRHGLVPLINIGLNDVAALFAQFYGEWNPMYRNFTLKSLSFAAEHLGIEAPNAHNGLADCLTTLAVLEKISEQDS